MEKDSTLMVRKPQYYQLFPILSIDSMCARTLSHFSCVWLFATLWVIAHQAPLSLGFSRQEYWSALSQDIFSPRVWNPRFLHLLHWQVGSLPLAPPGKQCNPNQNPGKLFCDYQQNDSNIYMEREKTQTIQHNNWRRIKLEDWHYSTLRPSIKLR